MFRELLKNYKSGAISEDEAVTKLEEREASGVVVTILLTAVSFIVYNTYVG